MNDTENREQTQFVVEEEVPLPSFLAIDHLSQQHEAVEDVEQHQEQQQQVELTPEQSKNKYDTLVIKREEERTAEDKEFLSAYEQEVADNKYEELLKKKDEELTEEDKLFIEENRPLTAIESAKVLSLKNYGIDLVEEEIPDTVEGLAQILDSIYNKGGEAGVDITFQQFPQLKHMYDYLSMGGDPERYKAVMYPDIDFSKVEIIEGDYDADENPQQGKLRKDILVYDLKMQGYDDQTILDIISNYEASGIEGKMAKLAQDKLAKLQKTQQDTILNEQATIQAEKKLQYDNYIKKLREDIMKAEDIAGLPVSTDKKTEFVQFLTMARQDSKIKNIPISQELVFHMFNPDSPLYNDATISDMRLKTQYWLFNLEKDPNFLGKVITNRATSLKANKSISKKGPIDRMRTLAKEEQSDQTAFLKGKLIM